MLGEYATLITKQTHKCKQEGQGTGDTFQRHDVRDLPSPAAVPSRLSALSHLLFWFLLVSDIYVYTHHCLPIPIQIPTYNMPPSLQLMT